MTINKQLSFLTVTYEHDFDALERLLVSTEKYFQNEYMHYIILNDDISHLPELNSILAKFSNKFVVVHRDEFPELFVPVVENCKFGTRSNTGWYDQIFLTMLSSKIIETTYYLHLCSKDQFFRAFDIHNIIRGDKFLAQREYHDHGDHKEQFIQFAINACTLFDLNFEQCKEYMIMPITPGILKTQHIKDILTYLADNNLYLIDVIGGNGEITKSYNKTIEYYLYSAWLAKNNLTNDTIIWYDNREWSPYSTIPQSYELRRTTSEKGTTK